MNRAVFSAALLLCSSLTFAQSSPKILAAPLAGTVTLRDVEDKYNAQVVSFEAPEPDGEGDAALFRDMKARVERQFPHRRAVPLGNAKATATAAGPVVIRGFVPDSLGGVPPDNYMAVNNGVDGANVMNASISTVNTATGAVRLRKSLYSFSSTIGLNNPTGQTYNYRYDPKVMYDPEADRFICVMLNGVNENNWIVFAFSQTNDPAGAWNFYKVYGDYAADTTWFDYPTVAMTHGEFFLTGNKLVYNGSFQTGFRKSVIYQVRKSDGYAGSSTLGYRIWDTVNFGGAPIRNIFPVKGGSAIGGPAQYFLSVRNVSPLNDSVFLLKIPDTMGAPGNAVSITAMKSNLVYGFPPNGRQKGTIIKLQTNDARVLGAFAEGSEIQFVSTTVQPATGADAIYHGRMANYTTTPSVQADYITVDTMDFAFPNISFTGTRSGLNTAIISFDYSGAQYFPGTGAVMWDGGGYSPLVQIRTGESFIRVITNPDTLQRWGDYTGSQPQWNVPGYVWMVGMYGKPNRNYGNWMALLRSPFVPAADVPAQAAPAASVLYPNPAMQYTRLRFSLKEATVLHFALYTVSGSRVDALIDARCDAGENEIQFNTAPLAPGHYILKGSSQDGKTSVTKTFVKR